MNLERIRQLAEEILAELNVGGVTVPVTPDNSWANETGFPKHKTFGRATFAMTAPTNPMWKPSIEAEVIGSQGAFLVDPGVPSGNRSPAGFPAVNGKPQWGGQVFDNDDQVLAVIAQEAKDAANHDAEWAKHWNSMYPNR